MIPELLKPAKRLCAAPATPLALMGTLGAGALAAVTWPARGEGLFASPAFLALSGAALAVLLRGVFVQAAARWRAPAGAARWGALLFHLGLAFTIVSGFATWAFQRRGFVQLMEGESFSGRQEDFLEFRRGRLAGRLDLPFSPRLERFSRDVWEDGSLRGLESRLTLVRPAGDEPRTLRVNHPARVGGLSLYQSAYHGVAVTLSLREAGRPPVLTHFLLDAPTRPDRPAVGGAEFPTTPYTVRLWLKPGRPVWSVVRRWGRVVYAGPLSGDRPAALPDGALGFVGLRPWSGLVAASDPGAGGAVLGFAVCVLGAAMGAAGFGKEGPRA
jgi:hypothetical protein